MDKQWYLSKTIQGIIIAFLGTAIYIFLPESAVLGQSLMVSGMAWAGIGFRCASK